MRAVRLARAVADPQEMRRAAVPIAGGGIDAGQRLLVRQQQRLVADVEIRLAQVARGRAGHAAGGHEGQRLVDAVRQVAVALGQRRALDEAQVPAVHLVQVGVAAGGEGAQQVQRAGRLEIAGLHARRIGHAGLGGEVRAVDDVAAVAGQRLVADASRCPTSAAWRTARPCGRSSPPAARRRRSAPRPSAAARGNVSRMMLAVKSAKLSAQSPPCSTKRLAVGGAARAAPSAAAPRRRTPAADSGRCFASIAASSAGVRIGRHLADRAGAPGIRGPGVRRHRSCSSSRSLPGAGEPGGLSPMRVPGYWMTTPQSAILPDPGFDRPVPGGIAWGPALFACRANKACRAAASTPIHPRKARHFPALRCMAPNRGNPSGRRCSGSVPCSQRMTAIVARPTTRPARTSTR